MMVRLTFKKDFGVAGGAGRDMASLMPYTTEGEPIDEVLSCSITQELDSMPVMTLKVRITETFSDNVALRLKK